MKLRVQIRERFNQMLLAYTHGTFFFGVAEVLEFLGCIINGFAMPLKDEHRTTLLTVFLPLHRHKSMAIYHPQLAYCVTQFLSKAPDLVERTLKYLFRYWPKTAAQKQVHLLNQVEGIVGVIEYPEFIQVAPMLFKKLGDCIEDTHFMVSVRCAFSNRILHSRMLLVPTPLLLCLKLLHACDQWLSSRSPLLLPV
jgi:serine/threonine-protein phosphatase 2A regulatory subunit B'